MRSQMWLLALSVVLLGAGLSAAEDKDKKPTEEKVESVEERFDKIVKLGPGVHAIKKDKKGRITSCLVVGQSRISTVLGKAKGLEIARSKAGLEAATEFVKWLKLRPTTIEASDEETVILVEGSEGDQDESLKEAGKTIEKSSKRMETVAQGLVRGLVVVHAAVDAEDKTYTVIKGWKADTAEGVKKVAKDLATDEPQSDKKPTKPSDDKPSKASQKSDKELKDRKATSDDAKDFLQ